MDKFYIERLNGDTAIVEAKSAPEAWNMVSLPVYVERWETAQAGPVWQAEFMWGGWAPEKLTSRNLAALGRMIDEYFEDVTNLRITKITEGGGRYAAV